MRTAVLHICRRLDAAGPPPRAPISGYSTAALIREQHVVSIIVSILPSAVPLRKSRSERRNRRTTCAEITPRSRR